MNIETKKKILQDISRKNEFGFVDGKVFKMGYSIETVSFYSILASSNGEMQADELLKIYNSNSPVDEEIEDICRYALWALYRDGFIQITTLTDDLAKEILIDMEDGYAGNAEP